jgi:hypothetical protein
LITGHGASFFGAVISEQAVRTTADTMAMAAKSLLRVMEELLIRERGRAGGTEQAKRTPTYKRRNVVFLSENVCFVTKTALFLSFALAPPRLCHQFSRIMSAIAI